MNLFSKLALAATALIAVGFAFQAVDPAEAIKEINSYRSKALADARAAGKQIDVAALQKETIDKAKAAVKGVDPAKIDAKLGYSWATLFQMAELHKEACDSVSRFLETNPPPAEKFRAQSLMMRSCNTLGEGHMLLMTLDTIVPPDAMSSISLASMTANQYAETIQKSAGLDAALKALDKVEGLLPAAEAFASDPDEKKREGQLNSYYSIVGSIAQSRSDLFTDAGKSAEALAALDAGIAKIPEKYSRNLRFAKTRSAMMNKPAPAIVSERSHGAFTGLDSLKGKVVLLDFFAHWCGPCIASFPDMKKLYADLKPQGLEIVGITTYYGYYRSENREKKDMTRDVEFGKMGEFIAEHQLPWPVVYGERTNFEAYGITGIPHVTLLDRAGNVHKIKIGYSAASFAKFREEIEKLIAEK